MSAKELTVCQETQVCTKKEILHYNLKRMNHFSQDFFFFLTGNDLPDFDRTIGLINMSPNFFKVPVTKFPYDQGVYYIVFTTCYL